MNKVFNPNKRNVVYHFVAVFFIFLLELVINNSVLFFIISGSLLSIVYSKIIINEFESRNLYITPVTALFIFPLLMFGLSAIYHGFYFIEHEGLPLGPVLVNKGDIEKGYIISLITLFFFHLGIELFRPKYSHDYLQNKSRSATTLILLFIFSVYVILNEQDLKLLGIFLDIIKFLPITLLSIFALTPSKIFRISEKMQNRIFIAGFLAIFVLNLFSLSKASVLYTFIPLIWFYLSKKYSFNRLIFIGIVFSVAYLFILQPLINNARYEFWSRLKVRDVPANEFIEYIQSGYFLNYSDTYLKSTNQFDIFMDRLFEIRAPGYIYAVTEQSGFKYGSTLIYALYGLIPRVFWSDKPIISRGGWFSEFLGFRGSSTGMSIAGELYWNFGYYGIVVGGLLLGIFLSLLWKQAGINPMNSILTMLIYIAALDSPTKGAEFGSSLLGMIQYLIFFQILIFASNIFFKRDNTSFHSQKNRNPVPIRIEAKN